MPPAESWSESLGHIQMVTSPESNQSSPTDMKLPLITEMTKTLAFTWHDFQYGTTECTEADTDSDCGTQNAECDSE